MDAQGFTPKAIIWTALAGAGAIAGLALGQFAIGSEVNGTAQYRSYSDLMGNPDALAVDAVQADPCYDCADSYGVAAQLSAERDDTMDRSFRELGAVTIDYASAGHDEYRYGGSFSDTDAPRVVMARIQTPPAPQPAPADTDNEPLAQAPKIVVITEPPADTGPIVNDQP